MLQKSYLFLMLAGLVVLVAAGLYGCSDEYTSFKVPPSGDVDLTESSIDTEQVSCNEYPTSCSSDSDCGVCGDGWQCCAGFCRQSCEDGDDDKDKDIEYQCPATGKECSSWEDCYMFCPVEERRYACIEGVCVFADEDGDEEVAESESQSEQEVDQIPEGEETDSEIADTTVDGDSSEESEVSDGVEVSESEDVVVVDGDEETDGVEVVEAEEGLDPNCYPTGENRPPVVDALTPITVNAGETAVLSIKAADDDPCDELSITCNGCPEGSTTTLVSGTAGTRYEWQFSWDTPSNASGVYTFSFIIADSGPGNLATTVDASITVQEVVQNQPPQIDQVPDRELLLGDKLEYTFGVSDPDGDELTLTPNNPLPPSVSMTLVGNTVVKVVVDAAQLSNPGQIIVEFTITDARGASAQSSIKVKVKDRGKADECDKAIKLFMNDKYYGTTEDRSNEEEPNPPAIEYKQAGPDMFFKLQRQPGQPFVAIVEPQNDSFDVGLAIWDGDDCNECISGDDILVGGFAERVHIGYLENDPGLLVVAVESWREDAKGPFMLTVSPENNVVGNLAKCDQCENNYDCGYKANCGEFYVENTLLERACLPNCNANGSCPSGFECKEIPIVGTDQNIAECVPTYLGGYQTYTCSALRELGNSCNDSNSQSDEAECGADDSVVVDDADCSTFDGYGSVCTYACTSDDHCPDGFSCKEWTGMPWSRHGYCLPDNN